jgi:hypothetical protein
MPYERQDGYVEVQYLAGKIRPDMAISRQMDAESWLQKVDDLTVLMQQAHEAPLRAAAVTHAGQAVSPAAVS